MRRTAAPSLTEVAPRLFSFNSPYGACANCSRARFAHGGRPRTASSVRSRALDLGERDLLPLAEASCEELADAHDPRRSSRGISGIRADVALAATCPRRCGKSCCSAPATASSTFKVKGRKRSSYRVAGQLRRCRAAPRERRYRETDSQSAYSTEDRESTWPLTALFRLPRPAPEARKRSPSAIGELLHRPALARCRSSDLRNGRSAGLELSPKREARDRGQGAPRDRRTGCTFLARCRCRLSVASDRSSANPVGRREPAHPAGHPDRQSS